MRKYAPRNQYTFRHPQAHAHARAHDHAPANEEIDAHAQICCVAHARRCTFSSYSIERQQSNHVCGAWA
eukprot:933843-Pleurochrysis_carterae.AAC.1